MTLTTSLANNKNHSFSSIFIWTIKKYLATIVVYICLLFMAFPMLLMLTAANNISESLQAHYATIVYGVFPYIFSVIVGVYIVIVAVQMFNIYHKKRSMDTFGALPIKRRTLFLSRYFTGLTIILVPFILVAFMGALIVLGASVDLFNMVLVKTAFIGLSLICSYTFCALFALLCGTTTDMIISVAAINLAYPILISLINQLCTHMLPGIIRGNLTENSTLITALSPYGSFFCSSMTVLNDNYFITNISQHLIYWSLFAVVCFILCLIIAKKRKAECAQINFAFKAPKFIITLISSVAGGMLIGLVFMSVNRNSSTNWISAFVWFIVGALLGSFICNLILTIIYNKGGKGFVKSLIVFAASFVIVAGTYGIICTGLFNSDIYVPSTDDVEGVYVSDSTAVSPDFTKINNDGNYKKLNMYISNKEIISDTIALHTDIVSNIREKRGYPYYEEGYTQTENGYNAYDIESFYVSYKLKNGSVVQRLYNPENYYSSEKVAQLINKAYSTDEFKSDCVALRNCQLSDINEINLNNLNSDNIISTSYTIDSVYYPQLIDALKKDMAQDTSFYYHYIINGSFMQRRLQDDEKNVIEIWYKTPNKNNFISFQNKITSDSFTITEDTYKNTWEVIKKYNMATTSEDSN